MSVTDVFNFEEFCKANPARPVDGYDYVHAICKSVGLPGDFLIWYAKLVCPDRFCRVVDQTAEIGRKRSCAPHTGRTTPAIAENWSANDIASAPSISN